MRLYAFVVVAASRWGVRAQRSPIVSGTDHDGRASHGVTVRVRGCGPYRLPVQIRAHCGGHSADGTFKNFCVEEYLELAFTQEHYRPRAGQRPDLDFIPWHCHDSLARATCAGHTASEDAPLLGSFTFVGHVFFKSGPFNPGSKVELIGALRQKHCPGAPLGNGNLALLGIEIPTVWSQNGHVTDGSFWWAGLTFTAPYSSTGYQVETDRGCEVRPALPDPGAPRPLLAVFLGTNVTTLRKLLSSECNAAPDCVREETSRRGHVGFARAGQEDAYLKATYALQPPGDTLSRKAYWDALAAGAINVLFSDVWADEVYADALIAPHAAYTVTVPKDVQQRGETLRYLRAIPAAHVLELQAAVARVRHRATYTAKGHCHDTASAIATGLVHRFRAYRDAMCYARRYPELAKRFCDQRKNVVQCDSVALRDHFNTTKGRKENPEFGCHGHHLGNSEPSRFDSFLGLSVDNRSRTLG